MGSGWTQLIIFLLAFGLPALGAVWKKLEEQREKHRIEQLRQQARQEQLRTGRMDAKPQVSVAQPTASAPPPAAADAVRKQRIAQIAARRRAQLEEFRRRQQQRQGGTARPGPSAARTAEPQPRPKARQSAKSRPSRGQTAGDRIAQRSLESQRQARADSAQKVDRDSSARQAEQSRRSKRSRHSTLNALGHESTNPASDQPRPVRVLGAVMTRQDWRRAIVLGEVLAPPVAMRPPAES